MTLLRRLLSRPSKAAARCSPRRRGRLAALLCLALGPLGGASVAAQSTHEAIAQTAPKVVKIFGAGGRKNLHAYGSGFLVSPQGHIVTVWSHILDGDSVTVVLHDGRRFDGKVLGAEPPLDLAVLKIDVDDAPCFDLARQTATASAGARVLAFSNVFKVATGDEPVTVMHGVIAAQSTLSARRGAFAAPYDGPIYIVDSVTNNSGAAGGALTTRDGRLLGMLGKELRDNNTDTWLNYVVPIGQLQPAIQEIITGRFTPRKTTDEEEATVASPNYAPADFGLVLIPDVVARTPAFVDRVIDGSPAQRAGLLTDDLILFVGETLVPSCRALREALGRLESGDTLRLVVRRGERLETFTLPVPRKPAAGEP